MSYTHLIESCANTIQQTSNLRQIESDRYSPAGLTFSFTGDLMDGVLWFYECEDFTIDIHDFNIKKECFTRSPERLEKFGTIFSVYILKGSGEMFHPYQKISAGTMMTLNTRASAMDFLLHKGVGFSCVEICFQNSFFEKCIEGISARQQSELKELFTRAQPEANRKIETIAVDIMNCKMENPAAKIFFEAKAKEWLSIILDAAERTCTKESEALGCVARYIDDHYAMDTSQRTLEKIAMMSGTKLKTEFKKQYGMTITEYTQRQRMSVAEILLLNTTLPIKDVAKAVGYNSPSRFSQLFKRYQNCSPGELRKN